MAEERKPTERVVLERRYAFQVPESISAEQATQIAEILGVEYDQSMVFWGWAEIGIGLGPVDPVIEGVIGKAGEPGTKIGQFKAPAASAWAAGLEMVAPGGPIKRSL